MKSLLLLPLLALCGCEAQLSMEASNALPLTNRPTESYEDPATNAVHFHQFGNWSDPDSNTLQWRHCIECNYVYARKTWITNE